MTGLKRIGKAAFPGLYNHYLQHRSASRERAIRAIASRADAPRPSESEERFRELQSCHHEKAEYKYDRLSNWRRGVERADRLLTSGALSHEQADILEVGCGDGMAGAALASYGHSVTLADFSDWRDPRARALPFTTADVCSSLPLGDSSYDLVFSFNTFEHLLCPDAALGQLVRVCRVGGTIHLAFGPLYSSPWGLHAYRTLYMPYSQFLFSDAFIQHKLEQLGIRDLGTKRAELQPLNRWRLAQFDQLWQNSGCTILSRWVMPDCSHLRLVQDFPEAFSGLGLEFEDLTTSNIHVVLQKPEGRIRPPQPLQSNA